MNFAQFSQVVPHIAQDRTYYFIRTDHGQFFETFVQRNFVAIGWNEITLDDINNAKQDRTRLKVGRLLGHEDIEQSNAKRDISTVLNKLSTFVGMRRGDIVVIPSKNSSRFAFGRVVDQRVQLQDYREEDCPYIKRRRVEWITQKEKARLHSEFSLIRAHHSIFELSEDYIPRIDSLLSSVYRKDDFMHLRIDVGTIDEIPLSELREVFDALEKLSNSLRAVYPDFVEPTIKVNLNSPGDIGIKFRNSIAASLLAFIVFVACSDDNTDQNAVINSVNQEIQNNGNFDANVVREAFEALENARDTIQSRVRDLNN